MSPSPGTTGQPEQGRRGSAVARFDLATVGGAQSWAQRLRGLARTLVLVDALAGVLLTAGLLGGQGASLPGVLAAAVCVGGLLVAAWVAGGYRLAWLRQGDLFGSAAAVAVAVCLAGLVVRLFALVPWADPLPFLPLWRIGLVGALAGALFAVVRLFAVARVRRWDGERLVVALGSGGRLEAFRQRLEEEGLADRLASLPGDEPVEATLERLAALLAPGGVSTIVLGTELAALDRRLQQAVVHARLGGVEVMTPTQAVEDRWQRTPIGDGPPDWILSDRFGSHASPWFSAAKRIVDLAVAVPALVLCAPVILLAGLAVTATSPGGMFYRQVRCGLRRRRFTIIKLRTMRSDAERGGAQWATAGDARVTTVGRFLRRTRIDELPQLWNVIVGEMSLVGPRPERPEFTDRLADEIPWYDLRHLVKPGLTGWAQVRAPYAASVGETLVKLEFDVYYLKHATLFLDLRILSATVGVMVGMRGH